MSRDIQVPEDIFELTGGTLAAPIDLVNTAFGGGAAKPKNRPAYYLKIVAGSGTIVVEMPGSDGVTRTLTVAAGEELLGKFSRIASVTGPTNIRAGWN